MKKEGNMLLLDKTYILKTTQKKMATNTTGPVMNLEKEYAKKTKTNIETEIFEGAMAKEVMRERPNL